MLATYKGCGNKTSHVLKVPNSCHSSSVLVLLVATQVEAQVDGRSRKGDGKGTKHRKRKFHKITVPLQRKLAVTLPPLGSACTCPLPHPSSQVPGPPWNLPHLGWREAGVFCSLKPQSATGGRTETDWGQSGEVSLGPHIQESND